MSPLGRSVFLVLVYLSSCEGFSLLKTQASRSLYGPTLKAQIKIDKMIGLIFLGLLCPVSTGTTLLHGGPVGIALCKRICETTFCCKSFTYLQGSSTCNSGILNNITEDQAVTGEVRVNKGTWMKYGITETTCPPLSGIIYSRAGEHVCIKPTKTEAKLKFFKYKYFTVGLSFPKAKMKCKEEGGSLAQFQHSFDEDALNQIFLGNSYDCAWIGLTYHKELDQFKSDDGTPYLGNDRWSAEEPSHTLFGFGEENCVCIQKSLLLKDFACNLPDDFICQIPI